MYYYDDAPHLIVFFVNHFHTLQSQHLDYVHGLHGNAHKKSY